MEKVFREQIAFLAKVDARGIGPSEQTRSCQGYTSVSVFSDEELKKLTTGMNELGKIVKNEGFVPAFHHHRGTGEQTLEETERFLNETNSDFVYLLYDSGHFLCYRMAGAICSLPGAFCRF